MNEIQQAIKEILPDVIGEAMVYYQNAIAKKGIVNTGELANSIESSIVADGDGVAGLVAFNEYGRYRDMKALRFKGKMPPIDEIEKWVLERGVSNFAWIPGYEKSGSVPSDSIAARRLANAISRAMQSMAVVQRKQSGTWYNSTKARMVNVARNRITKRVAELFTEKTKKDIESNNIDG